MTDNAYTKKQVLKIEDLLLQTLNFEVSTVTTHTFLLHYLKLAEVDEVTEDLARVGSIAVRERETYIRGTQWRRALIEQQVLRVRADSVSTQSADRLQKADSVWSLYEFSREREKSLARLHYTSVCP